MRTNFKVAQKYKHMAGGGVTQLFISLMGEDCRFGRATNFQL